MGNAESPFGPTSQPGIKPRRLNSDELDDIHQATLEVFEETDVLELMTQTPRFQVRYQIK
jgi:hypothetical protein